MRLHKAVVYHAVAEVETKDELLKERLGMVLRESSSGGVPSDVAEEVSASSVLHCYRQMTLC